MLNARKVRGFTIVEALASIFGEQLRLSERLRWRWSRLASQLEHLPPFWTAFALVLTETVGAGILAMPIALAGVGPPFKGR